MKRKPHTPDEKAKLVLEVFRGEKALNEIASENGIHPNMLSKWKKEAVAGLPSVFENDAAKKRKEQKAHEAELLGLNRTSLYCRPVPPSREDLDIKMRIDKIYTAHPDYPAPLQDDFSHVPDDTALS